MTRANLNWTISEDQAVHIKRDGLKCEIELMRFLYPYQAKREARTRYPEMCHHRSGNVGNSSKERA